MAFYTMDEDFETIEAVRNGDIEKFAILVEKYSSRVFRIVRRFAKSEADASDLAQEIWIKAFQKLGEFRGAAPFEHWVMRIATRACYDYLRSEKRRVEQAFSELSKDERDWLATYIQQPSEKEHDIAAARTVIKKLLDGLPPADRLLITLLEIEGKSIKEIAGLTGWSLALVKVRAFRARARMRQLLSKLVLEKYL